MKGEVKRGEVVGEWTGPEGERGGGKWGEKGGRKGARKSTRKTLILVPLWFRYSLVAFQFRTGKMQYIKYLRCQIEELFFENLHELFWRTCRTISPHRLRYLKSRRKENGPIPSKRMDHRPQFQVLMNCLVLRPVCLSPPISSAAA